MLQLFQPLQARRASLKVPRLSAPLQNIAPAKFDFKTITTPKGAAKTNDHSDRGNAAPSTGSSLATASEEAEWCPFEDNPDATTTASGESEEAVDSLSEFELEIPEEDTNDRHSSIHVSEPAGDLIKGVTVENSPLRRIKSRERNELHQMAFETVRKAQKEKFLSETKAGVGELEKRLKPFILPGGGDRTASAARASSSRRQALEASVHNDTPEMQAVARKLKFPTALKVATPQPSELPKFEQELKRGGLKFPLRKGSLYRRTGSYYSEWQKWDCTLRNGVLYFYDPEDPATHPSPVECVSLYTCPIVRILHQPETASGEGGAPPLEDRTVWDILHPAQYRRWLSLPSQEAATLFEVECALTAGIPYIFRANSPEEAREWVTDIQACISRWCMMGTSSDGTQSGWLMQYVKQHHTSMYNMRRVGRGAWKRKFVVMMTNGTISFHDEPPFWTPQGAMEVPTKEFDLIQRRPSVMTLLNSTRPATHVFKLPGDCFVKGEPDVKGRPYCFTVDLGEEVLLLDAGNPFMTVHWVKAIKNVVDHIKDGAMCDNSVHMVPAFRIKWLQQMQQLEEDELQAAVNSAISQMIGLLRGPAHVSVSEILERCFRASRLFLARLEECTRRDMHELTAIIAKALVRRIQYTLDELLFDSSYLGPVVGDGTGGHHVRHELTLEDLARIADFVVDFNGSIADIGSANVANARRHIDHKRDVTRNVNQSVAFADLTSKLNSPLTSPKASSSMRNIMKGGKTSIGVDKATLQKLTRELGPFVARVLSRHQTKQKQQRSTRNLFSSKSSANLLRRGSSKRLKRHNSNFDAHFGSTGRSVSDSLRHTVSVHSMKSRSEMAFASSHNLHLLRKQSSKGEPPVSHTT